MTTSYGRPAPKISFEEMSKLIEDYLHTHWNTSNHVYDTILYGNSIVYTNWNDPLAFPEPVRIEEEEDDDEDGLDSPVEFDGVPIPVVSNTQTLTNKTLTLGSAVVYQGQPIWPAPYPSELVLTPACAHSWIDTGMRKSWCRHCSANAEMVNGQFIEVK